MLCTQADVEKRLQWDITAEPDPTITMLIEDAQALIEAEVGRTLESANRTEVFDGGRFVSLLKWWPVTEVTEIREDAVVIAPDNYRWYEHGLIARLNDAGYSTLWQRRLQTIEVDYVGGYLAGKPDHDMALQHLGNVCAEVVARAFRKGADSAAIPAGAAGQVQSVSASGSDTVTFATAGGAATFAGGLTQFIYLEEDERRQLSRYKSPAVA